MKDKYIIISLSKDGKEFNQVLPCDFDDIMDYVKRLGYDDEVQLVFFSVKRLSTARPYGKYYSALGAVNEGIVKMDRNKALAKFEAEVDKILNELEIKEKE